jgi:GntR family transcriptional regulator
VISIERIRYAKTTPIIYSIDILPKSKLPEDWKEDDFKGSLFNYLETRCGVYLDHSQASIRATLLHGEINQMISDPLIPWVLLEQVLYDRNGEPISLSRDYHRGDYIVFHVRRFRR